MVDVSRYLGQNLTDISIRDYVTSRIPGLQRSDPDATRVGIAGFTAYVELSEKRILTATAPDIVLEDGTTAHDTIFRGPVQLELEGELASTNIPAISYDAPVDRVNQAIGVITPYLPNRTQAAVSRARDLVARADNVLRRVDDVIQQGARILDVLNPTTPDKTNAEQFIDVMDALHFSGTPFTIESPNRLYENVVLTSLETSLEPDTGVLSFKLQVKQLRFAETEVIPVESAPNPSPGTEGKASQEVDKGSTEGEARESSLLFRGLGLE